MSSSPAPVTGQDLESAGIIPDVLPTHYATSSFALFPVTFAQDDGAEVDRGNTLLPSAARQPQYSLPPSITTSSTSSTDLYCVIVYDPDGPSRRNPRLRNIVHLIHANIPATAFTHTTATAIAGVVHVPYRPPGPPPSSGKHRYVWLLYRQAAVIDVTQLPSFVGMSATGKQKPDEMEEKLTIAQGTGGGMELVAVNWHDAEWEPWVTEQFKDKHGWMAIPMLWFISTFIV